MSVTRLDLTRSQILAFRRYTGGLDERLPPGADSLRRAAWAGLQDSMPRAALLSIHARVEGAGPATWADPSLVQLWGPRFSVFVVAARDLAVFSLGTLPDDTKGRRRAENLWTVPPPETAPLDARLELARRYLRIYGPATPEAFGRWAGIGRRYAEAAFEALRGSLTPVRTPIGDAWIRAEDEAAFRAAPGPVAPVRLLPSGDAYFLLQGADRELQVPEAGHRNALWTPRVWPGGLLLAGQIAGTWRRAGTVLTIQPWRVLSSAERDAVAAEADSLPLPVTGKRIVIRWDN